MTTWEISYSVSVEGEDYTGKFETNSEVMNDYVARDYVNHFLHVETDAPVDKIDVGDVEVSFEKADNGE